jgi:hypothetical protein
LFAVWIDGIFKTEQRIVHQDIPGCIVDVLTIASAVWVIKIIALGKQSGFGQNLFQQFFPALFLIKIEQIGNGNGKRRDRRLFSKKRPTIPDGFDTYLYMRISALRLNSPKKPSRLSKTFILLILS